ncbi:MAG: TIGR03905 family TSCPD domain-containing protein [Clostridia bacterium]|nr:TIGR03905 family TSCPD domain-containing protein [Clostridia bacterium]
MQFTYKTSGVCSRAIEIEVENGTVISAKFIGGCNGNTQGISKLVAGMKVDDVIDRLSSISCNGRPSSCPDQLAQALKQAKETV